MSPCNVAGVAPLRGPPGPGCHRIGVGIGHTDRVSAPTASARPLGGPRRAHRVTAVAVTLLLAAIPLLAGCSLFDKKVDVLYIGDSIMVQTSPFVEGALVAEPGVDRAKTRADAVNGSGLLTPAIVDWPERARDLIDRYQPKVVVVLFVGNYTDKDLWTGADGQPVANDYGPAFFTEWGIQAEKFTTLLSSRGAQVDWVLPPPLAGPEGARRQAGLRATYEELQARVPAITLIDGVKALGGTNGEWVWRRPGIDGGEVTVRAGDSVHLTDDGGRLMARELARTVAPQLLAARAKQPS